MVTISYFKLLLFLVVQVFPAPLCECPTLPSQMTCTGISPQTLQAKPTSPNFPHYSPLPSNSPQLLPTGCSASCNITSLTVFDSDLSGLDHHLSGLDHHLGGLDHHWLHRLNLCPSSLVTITVRKSILGSLSLPPLPQLQTLDLRENKMVLPLPEPDAPILNQLFLSANSWPCILVHSSEVPNSASSLTLGSKMAWLLKDRWSSTWVDQQQTLCGVGLNQGLEQAWYFRERKKERKQALKSRNLKSFLEFSKITLSSCPERCKCALATVAVKFSQQGSGQDLRVSVSCSGGGLQEPPLVLPPNTVFLDLSNNSISSLGSMGQGNPTYEGLEGLSMANNSLTSLDGIASSWLMRGARMLNLQNNQLVELDTLLLDPILGRSLQPRGFESREAKFYLAGNPWSCPCQSIHSSQDFLEKYNNIVMDAEEVECSQFPGRPLLHLDFKALCSSSRGPNIMIVIIITEVLLLVTILAKFSWDCVVYHRTGQLPWLAQKLCWSVPGISRARWTSSSSNVIFKLTARVSSLIPSLPSPRGLWESRQQDGRGGVGGGSSGYITSSNSSNRISPAMPGGREDSVVRFV